MATKTNEQSCGSCRWGDFWLTPTGRFRKSVAGRCLYRVPPYPGPLPDSLTKSVSYRPIETQSLNGVWPDHKGCPTWEAKD